MPTPQAHKNVTDLVMGGMWRLVGLGTKLRGPGSRSHSLLRPYLVWGEKRRCRERVDGGYRGGGSGD